MTMILTFTVYIERDNAYGYSEDISESKSLRYTISENGSRIVAKNEFYFVNGIEKLNVKVTRGASV